MEHIFDTRINAIIKARLKMLKSLLEESGQIEHSSTKGSLREGYLVDFIRSLLPPNLAVTGGFICDVLGSITPQIDLVVSDTTTIPSIAFTGEIALVPVEAALVGIEVKSQLKTKHLDQIRSQARAINSLRPMAEKNDGGLHQVALFVFAFESTVSEGTLTSWLRDTPVLMGICVPEKFFIRKSPTGIVNVKGNEWKETIIFVSSLLDSIAKALEVRPPQSLQIWRKYVIGINTDATF